ncbi:MAG: UbiA family prenyltransferase, partial [Desulfobacterales bacterium]|nr:UbiA family prenyltransferase [Desulfobacterales bacterium]MDX2510468.1 UbiA family prenyltransferase [Desulfobacterales bacterium]
PRVIKVQTIIRKHAQKGYASIIVGDKDHPEVVGLLGYAGGRGYVADNFQALNELPEFEKAIIVAQTTQNVRLFDDVRKWVSEQYPHYKIYNTICDSTERRQAEVRRITKLVDAVIVVGGHNSGNTQRLSEIALQAGKPVYHIETESELDLEALSLAKCIGITAGASTPNWIIKRVYRKLETLPTKGAFTWRKPLYLFQRALLLTNIVVAVGAGSLCFASARLQGIESFFPQMLIAALYVQSMHILNHLMGRQSDRFNDPDRSEFYIRYRLLLSILAIAAGGAGLLTAYGMGWMPFIILLVMSIFGFSYNLKLIPDWLPKQPKYKRIKDIPGSKTILIAVAWGIVSAIFPSFERMGDLDLSILLTFFWATLFVFVRTAFFDVLDMQGDRIVGKETLPILMGEKRTLRILKLLLLISTAILVLASAFGIFNHLGYALAICPVLMLFVLLANEKELMLPGIHLEFLIESHFVLAGIIALVWSVLT